MSIKIYYVPEWTCGWWIDEKRMDETINKN